VLVPDGPYLTIYVEGRLLKHKVHNTTVTTRLHPVLYIPKLSVQLLSMGEFLQQGLSVTGDAHCISIQKDYKVVLQCSPLFSGQTVYWLDASTEEVEHLKANTIYSVDYDLMHKHLGHLSKDVLTHAKDKTKGFPQNLTIPEKPHVCPSCAKGKMPASSHPPSETRATKPFELIHSDIKSFPIVSYHKYKYFISFGLPFQATTTTWLPLASEIW
jgi:GAG-pre-integrase domain